jgi:hypothetical protein
MDRDCIDYARRKDNCERREKLYIYSVRGKERKKKEIVGIRER